VTRRIRALGTWAAAAALTLGVGRWIAYSLAGSGTVAQRLSGAPAGPALIWVAACSLAVAAAIALTSLWLVAAGIRERSRLDLDGWASPPTPIRWAAVVRRAAALWAVDVAGLLALDCAVHCLDGFGFHGMACLASQAHRDAVAVLAALSLLASALAEAAGHVLSALRRYVAELVAARPPRDPPPPPQACPRQTAIRRRRLGSGANLRRGPPASVVA
jgi:hypothetical protein